MPYCELPSEARALFTIFGLAAATRFVAKPPRRASLDSLLNVVWDAERLTLNNLSDPNRMTSSSSSTWCRLARSEIVPLLCGG
jgi:hypothetical protein